MILHKITTGFVVQRFDADTGHCLDQQFTAGDQIEWEDPQGNPIEDGQFGIDLEGLYFPMTMQQPPARR